MNNSLRRSARCQAMRQISHSATRERRQTAKPFFSQMSTAPTYGRCRVFDPFRLRHIQKIKNRASEPSGPPARRTKDDKPYLRFRHAYATTPATPVVSRASDDGSGITLIVPPI